MNIETGTLVRFKCMPHIAAGSNGVDGIVFHNSPGRIRFFLPKITNGLCYGYVDTRTYDMKEVMEIVGVAPRCIWEVKYPELARYWDHELPYTSHAHHLVDYV